MILSINKLFTRAIFVPVAITIVAALVCFKTDKNMNAARAISWSNACFSRCYDASAKAKLKKNELSISPELFVRLRNTFVRGKQEYYSFHISQFNDLAYLGVASTGTLQLKTGDDNIIEQTYNDPKGNEDNMVSVMSIPVKNMEPERLDSLRMVLLFLKNGK